MAPSPILQIRETPQRAPGASVVHVFIFWFRTVTILQTISKNNFQFCSVPALANFLNEDPTHATCYKVVFHNS